MGHPDRRRGTEHRTLLQQGPERFCAEPCVLRAGFFRPQALFYDHASRSTSGVSAQQCASVVDQKPLTAKCAKDSRRSRRRAKSKSGYYLLFLLGRGFRIGCVHFSNVRRFPVPFSESQEASLKRSKLVVLCSLFLGLFLTAASEAQIDDATRQLSHDIFKQLIEINSTDSVGSVTAAAEAMAQRFRDAGFAEADMQLLGPNDRKKNLVVRLRGTEKHKPLLLIGHLDVVEAHREDWTTDPFSFVEKDGFYYGRGTQDMKSGDAIMATTLIRFKKGGYAPDRDIILALTADEEGGKSNGVDWLLKNHRELIDAEMVFNHDGGGILSDHGKPVMMTVDATEKLYADFQLSVTNPGGHSS